MTQLNPVNILWIVTRVLLLLEAYDPSVADLPSLMLELTDCNLTEYILTKFKEWLNIYYQI